MSRKNETARVAERVGQNAHERKETARMDRTARWYGNEKEGGLFLFTLNGMVMPLTCRM